MKLYFYDVILSFNQPASEIQSRQNNKTFDPSNKQTTGWKPLLNKNALFGLDLFSVVH